MYTQAIIAKFGNIDELTPQQQPLFRDIFAWVVAQYPDKVAVGFHGQTLTYRELDDQSSQMAQRIRKKFSYKNEYDRVAVIMPKCLEYYVALLAVWKAGGTLVLQRPSNMGLDLQIAIVHPRYESSTASINRKHTFFADIEKFFEIPLKIDSYAITPQSEAHIVFTSGTTSEPKGAINSHEGLYSRILSHIEALQLNEQSIVAQDRPLHIDASLQEIMMTWAVGARLEVIPEGLSDWQEYLHYFNSRKITCAIVVPSILRQIAQQYNGQANPFTTLRFILTTGESMSAQIYQQFYQWGMSLVNGYGPSETTIGAMLWPYQPDQDISIGRPMLGVKASIRDGQLAISGLGVGLGYTNNPELTQKRFITENGQRYYLTGDVVSHDKESDLYYISGRNDRQLKINGNLITPEQIEAVIKELDYIETARVDVLRNEQYESLDVLIAGVQFKAGKIVPLTEIRKHLKTRFELEPNKIPTRWKIFTSAVEKTRALWKDAPLFKKVIMGSEEEKEFTVIVSDTTTYKLSEDESIIAKVARAFKAVLPQGKIFLHATFRELGGSSLWSMSLANKLREEFKEQNIKFVAGKLLNQSIKDVAQEIETQAGDVQIDQLNKPQGDDYKKNLPVFFIHALLGDAHNDYDRFTQYFTNRLIYGISVKTLNVQGSIDAYAQHYKEAIKIQFNALFGKQSGPYILVGWSSGGVIAHRVSTLLRQEGYDVALFMLDSTSGHFLQTKMTLEECRDYTITLAKLTGRFLGNTMNIPLYLEKVNRINLSDSLEKELQIENVFRQLESINESFQEHPNYKGNMAVIRNAWSIALGVLRYQDFSCKNQLPQPVPLHDRGIGALYCQLFYAKNNRKELGEKATSNLGWDLESDQIIELEGSHLSIMNKDKDAGFETLIEQLHMGINKIQDNIFYIARKNPIVYLPFEENTKFTGRESLLLQLKIRFLMTGAPAVRQAIVGLGGVGKTQLAIKYAQQAVNCEKYDLVWYLSAESFDQDYVGFACGLGVRPDVRKEERIILVREKLAHFEKWLIIIDEVMTEDHKKDVEKFFPNHKGHILLISRNDHIVTENKSITRVDCFEREESISFIKNFSESLKKEDEALANELANLLGDFPLAISQACAYIRDEITIKKYIYYFNECREKLQHYSHTVAVTLSMIIEKVVSESSLARELLYYMAYMSAKNIPISVLLKCIKGEDRDFPFTEATRALKKYFVIQVSEDKQYFSIHSLVQMVLRDNLLKEGKADNYTSRLQEIMFADSEKFINYVLTRYTIDSFDYLIESNRLVMVECRNLQPHLISLLKYVKPTLNAQHVLVASCFILENINKEAILKLEEILQSTDQESTDVHQTLSLVYLDNFLDNEALAHLLEALRIDDNLAIDHFKTVLNMNIEPTEKALNGLIQLAMLYLRGNFNGVGKAIACYQRALEIDSALYGDQSHVRTVLLQGLIQSYVQQGNPSMVEFYEDKCIKHANQLKKPFNIVDLKRYFASNELVYGREASETITSLRYMGEAYARMGQYREALKTFLGVRNRIFKRHGKNFSYIDCLRCIAKIYVLLRDYKNALAVYEDMKATLTTLSDNGVSVNALVMADIYYHLARVNINLQEFNLSLKYLNTAFKIFINNIDKNHPVISEIYRMKGKCYFNKGDYDQSLNYYAMALSVGKKDLPFIGRIYHGIADCCNALARYSAALSFYRKALGFIDTPENAAGEIYYSMAVIYFNFGLDEEIMSLCKSALRRYQYSSYIHQDVGCALHILGKIRNKPQYLIRAEQCFLRSIDLGEQAGNIVEFANFLYEQKRFNEALIYLEKVINSKELIEDKSKLIYSSFDIIVLPSQLFEKTAPSENIECFAGCFAYYLSILIVLGHNNLMRAEQLLETFKNFIEDSSKKDFIKNNPSSCDQLLYSSAASCIKEHTPQSSVMPQSIQNNSSASRGLFSWLYAIPATSHEKREKSRATRISKISVG